MYYHNLYQKFFYKSILVNRIGRITFSDLRYRKKDLSFYNKKIEEKR